MPNRSVTAAAAASGAHMASTATAESFFVPCSGVACSLAIYAFRVLLAIFVFHHDVAYALARIKERLAIKL